VYFIGITLRGYWTYVFFYLETISIGKWLRLINDWAEVLLYFCIYVMFKSIFECPHTIVLKCRYRIHILYRYKSVHYQIAAINYSNITDLQYNTVVLYYGSMLVYFIIYFINTLPKLSAFFLSTFTLKNYWSFTKKKKRRPFYNNK